MPAGSLMPTVSRGVPHLYWLLPSSRLALAGISIVPRAQVWSGVLQTAALLSHEQWHYDVATITGRALCRELARLRGTSLADLRAKIQTAVQLHFHKRAGILQKRYDLDTSHGTNAHYQKIWKDRMTATLANASADTMGGFWL